MCALRLGSYLTAAQNSSIPLLCLSRLLAKKSRTCSSFRARGVSRTQLKSRLAWLVLWARKAEDNAAACHKIFGLDSKGNESNKEREEPHHAMRRITSACRCSTAYSCFGLLASHLLTLQAGVGFYTAPKLHTATSLQMAQVKTRWKYWAFLGPSKQ